MRFTDIPYNIIKDFFLHSQGMIERTTDLPSGVLHTITTSVVGAGTISPSGTIIVNEGLTRLFTFTPDGGHSITDVLIDDVSVGAVSSYIFINILSDHTITVQIT